MPIKKIKIILNDDHIEFDSFDEITILKDYNKIICIDCSFCEINELPELPKSLKTLICSHNNLSSLPKLPNTLTYLNCTNNNLSSLPELPNSLTHLDCFKNKLTHLPILPNNILQIRCHNNNLTSLPYNMYVFDIKSFSSYENNINDWKFIFNNNPIWSKINSIKPLIQENIYMSREQYKTGCNVIGLWYLECKYNPKYKKCRERLENEYKQIYDENDNN